MLPVLGGRIDVIRIAYNSSIAETIAEIQQEDLHYPLNNEISRKVNTNKQRLEAIPLSKAAALARPVEPPPTITSTK